MKIFKKNILQPWTLNVFITVMVIYYTDCKSQSTPKRALLAISKANHTMAIVDPATLKIVNQIPVGEDPHEVCASTDGKTAFVCIYGGGALHKINIIDLVAQKPQSNFDTRPLFGPHDITFVNGKAWFTAEGSKAVGRFDPATGKSDWSMGTGQDRTHMIYVSPDEKKICTTNVSSGTVSILSDTLITPFPGAKPHSNWFQVVIPTARGSEGFDVSPDGKVLWTASSEDGSITIIDLIGKKQSAKLDAKVNGANRLKFTPDGKQAFISSLRSGELIIFDVNTQKELKRIKLGKGAAGILMDAVAGRAFIACSADNNIAIVDLKTLEVTGHLDVGGNPDGLAWAIRQ